MRFWYFLCLQVLLCISGTGAMWIWVGSYSVKSPETRPCGQRLVRDCNTEWTKHRLTSPLWGEPTCARWIPMMTSSNGNIFRVTGPLRGPLIFSLICAWINGWVYNRGAGDLRCYLSYYDVIEMLQYKFSDVESVSMSRHCHVRCSNTLTTKSKMANKTVLVFMNYMVQLQKYIEYKKWSSHNMYLNISIILKFR